MKKIINLTPHVVRLNNGMEIPPDGTVARCSMTYAPFDDDHIGAVEFSVDIEGLPAPVEGTIFVVSALVASVAKRPDVVSPASGHPDCVRVNGQVYSVPGFFRHA